MDGQGAAPNLVTKFHDRLRVPDARVADQDIDPAELRARRLNDRRSAFSRSDAVKVGIRLATRSTNFRRDRLAGVDEPPVPSRVEPESLIRSFAPRAAAHGIAPTPAPLR
jgi:hypothetical protein